VVGRVGVEPLRDNPRGYRQGPPPRGHLDRLKVLDRFATYERFDLGRNLSLKRLLEPPFFAASCEAASGASISASAHRSQASQYASKALRNCWPASICRRRTPAIAAGTIRETLFPPTVRTTLV
jgi:hypothetical protein